MSIHRLSSIKGYGIVIVFKPVTANKDSNSKQDASQATIAGIKASLLLGSRYLHNQVPATVNFFLEDLGFFGEGKRVASGNDNLISGQELSEC